MADDGPRRKQKWGVIPVIAVAAVILVGGVGLVRGCSYAADDPNYQNSANGVREDPAV
jgi:hypothetical protein